MTKLLCKLCKDSLQIKDHHKMIYCQCGKLGLDGMGFGAYRVHGNRDDYAMVDDQGNEIVPPDVYSDPRIESPSAEDMPPIEDNVILGELSLALTHTIEAMESLSTGGRFSPATNQDLLAHFLWVQAFLRVQRRILKQIEEAIEATTAATQAQEIQIDGAIARLSDLYEKFEALRVQSMTQAHEIRTLELSVQALEGSLPKGSTRKGTAKR